MLTVEDLVQWILKNRRGVVFEGWTEENLRPFLLECIDHNLLFYGTDPQGDFTSVVTVQKRSPFRLYLAHALTTKPGELGRQFFERLFILWPGVKYVEADRHGKTHEYRVEDLKRKLQLLC